MNNLYDVVGEHHSSPDRLLVIGEDGTYYVWELDTDETLPVQLSPEWKVDADLPEQLLNLPAAVAGT